MAKILPCIYFFYDKDFFSVSTEESIGYGMEIPDYLDFIATYKCIKCGIITIYSGTCEAVESEEREMGAEVFFHVEDDYKCEECGANVTIEFDLDEYAMGWSLSEESNGLELIGIDGLDWLAKEYWQRGIQCLEKEQTAQILRLRLDAFIKHTEKHKMYVLIVEGKDDKAVWTQLLIREGIPTACVEVVTFGEGGIDEAIKLAMVFRGAKLQNVPNLLVIDSDNKLKEKIAKIKEKGIKNYKILKEKEIDSYLVQSDALARVLSVSNAEVRAYSDSLTSNGKEKLENIYKHFAGSPPSSDIKGLIARALVEVPEEFLEIIGSIRTALSSRPDESIDQLDSW